MKLATAPKTNRQSKQQLSPEIEEIHQLSDEALHHLRKSAFAAVRVGLRLLVIWKATAEGETEGGGFRAALAKIDGKKLPPATAYRWMNAAGGALCRLQECKELDELEIPERGTKAWDRVEKDLEEVCQGMTLRRLILGAPATGEENRLEALITKAEENDKDAEEILDEIARGNLTLVQAIRALSGRKATKGKERKDPVYLDLDGSNGQPKGLFVKSLLTLANTFKRWETLDEAARRKGRDAWKALVAELPKELR